MTLTVNRHLFEMRRQLEAKGVESAALFAKLLMMHALETDQAGLIGAGERILTGKVLKKPSEAS